MQRAVRDMLGWEGEEEELRLKKLQKARTLEAIVNALAMSGESEEVTRLRKPRFSYEENQILIREVRSHYSMLYGAQARRLSVAERRRVWEGIADKINAITNWKRTAQEVQKRWNDFKRRTKEKLARVPHSTQNGTAEEVLTAEEETIFAILGPGVVPAGHEVYIPHSVDLHLPGPASSSTENSLSGPCYPPDPPLLLQPKQSLSPTPQIHVVQLPQLIPSPGPSEGASPAPMPPGSSSPLLSPGAVSQHYDPTVAMLRAQQETAEAIRHLTYTLRQSMDRLTNVLAAILPLIPPQPPSPAPSGLIDPVYYPTKTEPESEPCSVNYELEGNHNGQEEESGQQNVVVEEQPSPPTAPPPNKRKRFSYLTPRKRRGRWKNL
ncbi:myb-related transcription factor, partner of profilin-like [Rana temporaria]|uniref:myb-related transcription factor, partner of profilin-like n=1 Tax=Rana temporaria TaxID=8407 RepID=UPI001AAD5EE1|nr:myb-related transcription factor, partner of profilin-like [Rana temporaria]